MPVSPAVLAAAALGGYALYRYKKDDAKKKASASLGSSSSQLVLDLHVGPTPDPCLGTTYSQTAQPLLEEAYVNLKPEAQALYGQSPVFYMTPEAQGQAFTQLASLIVNEPAVDAVTKVVQDLAPACAWLHPSSGWSPSMVAFRNSVEKMSQVLYLEIGDSQVIRPHAWETDTWVLRDGQTLNLDSGALVAFELPGGDGDVNVQVQVTPRDAPQATVEQLGIHSRALPDPGTSNYQMHPVLHLRPLVSGWIPPGEAEMTSIVLGDEGSDYLSRGGRRPVTFLITATRSSGGSTSGTLKVKP